MRDARAFFDAIAGRYDRVYALPRAEAAARMKRVLGELPRASRVLDLGVGTGRELSALLDAGHAVTGLDFSKEMLARCARRSRPVPLVLADLWEGLPFEPAEFEAVVALHGTLAHPSSFGALSRLLREVARVLAPGGVFVAEVPTPAWLDRARWPLEHSERGRGHYTDEATRKSIDVRLFDEDDWLRAIEPHLRVVTIEVDGGELFVVAAAS